MQPINQEIYMAIQQGPHKMDKLFYNSIQKSKKQYIKRSILHIIKLIIICVFLPIDLNVLGTTQVLLIVFMAVAIAVVAFNLLITFAIIKICYGDNSQNNRFFIVLAKKLLHCVRNEPIQAGTSMDKLTNCVSEKIYNQSSGALNDDQGLTEQIRDRYQSIYVSLISAQTLNHASCLQFFEKNGKFGSFCLIIYGIVALSLSQCNSAQIGVLVTFIVLQALNIWIVIVALLIVALSPLIIFILCIVCCCCVKQPSQLNVPNAVEATPHIIQQTDGTCPICFQNFVPAQKVIILRCSKKHVFHQGCLGNWIRVSQTCPMCRKPISDQNQ